MTVVGTGPPAKAMLPPLLPEPPRHDPPAPPPLRPSWQRRIVEVAVVPAAFALLSVLSCLPWLRALDVHLAPAVLFVAAVAPFAITVAATRVAKLPPLASYGASLAGLVVTVLAGVSPLPRVLGSSLAHTPDRFLTETLPLTGGRALLLVPVLVVWVAAAATAELAERSAGSGALGVPVVAYLIAYAASSGAPSSIPATGGLLLAGLVVAALALRARNDARRLADAATVRLGPTGEVRRLAVGLLAGAVLAALAATQVSRLPVASGRPAALHRHTATTSDVVVDPVDAIGALRDDDPHAAPTTLAQVTTSAASTGYAPIATLDDYNGAIWSFARAFRPTGGRIPAAAAGTLGAQAVERQQTVTQSWRLLPAYHLPFLPALDRPLRVSGLPVDDDPVTGMAVPAGTLALPASYAVVSRAPATTLAALPSGSQVDDGTGAGGGADLSLPAGSSTATTSALQFVATLTGVRPAPTVAFLQTMVTALDRAERRVDPALPVPSSESSVSRGGTSLAEVVNAVTVSHKATPEQFATFFVVVARALGVPARIATGFVLRSRTSAGASTVTNRDAWTWAEIPVLGSGWVVVDPTPALTASAAAPPTPASASPPTTLAPHRANAVPNPGAGGNRALAPRARIHARGASHPDPWPGRLLLVLVFLAALGLAGPGQAGARRLARRQLRRGPGPAGLAVGAWLELLDGIELAGLRTPPGATGAEVVAAVERRFGPDIAPDVAAVAATAGEAVFRPGSPPEPAAAEAAWRLQRDVVRRLHRSLTRQARLAALYRVGHQPRRPVRPAPSRRPVRRRPVRRPAGSSA